MGARFRRYSTLNQICRKKEPINRGLFLVSLIYMAALLYAPDVRAQGVGEGEPAPSYGEHYPGALHLEMSVPHPL